MIIFKFLGFFLGFKLGGFHPGSQLMFAIGGLFFGHLLDKSMEKKLAFLSFQKRATKEAQAAVGHTFVTSYIGLLRIVAEIDGKITKEELDTFEKVITSKLKVNRKGKSFCRATFKKRSNQTPQLLAAQILQVYGQEPVALENVLYSLFEMAASDAPVGELELNTLAQIALFLGVPEDVFLAISAHFGIKSREWEEREQANSGSRSSNNGSNGSQQQSGSSDTSPPPPPKKKDPYEILGCKKEATADELKQRYRKLAMDYHPDRIASKELPEDFIKFASARFQEVQKAYDTIREERGF